MSLGKLVATAGVLAFVASPLLAQQGSVKDDSKFILGVATDNLLEIRLGDLATQKATNASVKQFGQQMVNDHTTMLNQWRTLVSQTGYPFQPGLNKQQQDEFNRLSKLSGSQFDQALMTKMINDHQTEITKFQSEGMAAKSTEVRQLVTSSLPTLQQHLTLANQVGAQVGATTTVAVGGNPPTNPVPQGAPGGGVTPGQTTPPGQVSTPGQVTTTGQVATQTTTTEQKNIKADARFIQAVNQGNLLQLRLNQLALQEARNPEVKGFAQRMLSDFTSIQTQWNTLGSSNGMTLTPVMGPKHNDKLKEVRKKSGKDGFDKAYMTMVIRNLKDYLDYLQKDGREKTKSSQVRNLVNNEIPTLANRFNEAKRIGSQVDADTSPTLRAVSTK